MTLKAGEIYTLPVSLAVDPYNLKRPALDIQFVLKREGRRPMTARATCARAASLSAGCNCVWLRGGRYASPVTSEHGNGGQW